MHAWSPLAILALLLLVVSAVLYAMLPACASASAPGTVLVTGANRGIGLELVRQYGGRGWQVIATARRPEEATELRRLAAANPAVVIEALDVTDHAQIDALARKYADRPLDLLINNAGITGGAPSQVLGEMDYEVLRQVFEVNTVAPLKMAEAFLPQLAAARGKIVTISSSQGSLARVDKARLYFYRASKAAVNMLMRNLAFDVKPRGITVALVHPGAVDTDMMRGSKVSLEEPPEAVARIMIIIDRVTLRTSGRFWDRRGGELPW